MKNLFLTIILGLGLFGTLTAQNVWKPIGMEGEFLGVSANGDMFCSWGYSGLYRSHDEGVTWESIYAPSYVTKASFMINELDRIFVFSENNGKLYYSDDNGDTWQEQASGISTNWVQGMFSLSNDTIFMANPYKFFWTLDGGESWNETPIDFIGDAVFGSILADHEGNVYVSTYSWTIPVDHTGIYTATLDDMTHWTVKTQGGARDMAFDSDGNILAASPGTFYYDNGVYFVNADRFVLAEGVVIFAMKRVDWDNEALFYSTDHGQTYTQCSENIPSTTTAPDPDLGLYKGRDNHLYCHGDVWEPEFVSQYYKSIRNINDILNVYPSVHWDELVTEQPAGYVVMPNGDVQIWSPEGLAWLISAVNGLNGQEPDNFVGKKVTLCANVDMSAALWTPIADGTNSGNPNPDRLKFCGTFDGNGFEINWLYQYHPWMDSFSSFFGHLCGATIKNVVVNHVYATGRSERDGLFFANADAQTVIDQCRFEVDEVYKSDMNVDYSIFGYNNEGTIRNCITKVKKVDYQGHYGINMDMFVRYNNGTIQNCASVADSVKWLYSYGGMAGTNNGLIENCYSYIGDWFGDYEVWWPPAPRQGMCFYNNGTIRNCYYNSQSENYYITDCAAYYNEGTIEQTAPFVWDDRWRLTNSVQVQGQGDAVVETSDLLEALNTWVHGQEFGFNYASWNENSSFVGHNLPELDDNINPYPTALPENYWYDIVTSQPDGYDVDDNGDIHIYTAEALAWLISVSNGLNGATQDSFEGKTITLEADVDISRGIWTSIGQTNEPPEPPAPGKDDDEFYFEGTFNGKGHTIYRMATNEGFIGDIMNARLENINIKYAFAENTPQPLFVSNCSSSVVDRCWLDGVVYVGEGYGAFFGGSIDLSNITNCIFRSPLIDNLSGTTSGLGSTTFLAGNNYGGVVENCAFIVDSIAYPLDAPIVMLNYSGTIRNCYSYLGAYKYFDQWTSLYNNRSGVVGINYGTVEHCYYNWLDPDLYHENVNTPAYYAGGYAMDATLYQLNDDEWMLQESVTIGEVETDNLIEALNVWASTPSTPEAYLPWHEDRSIIANGLPVLYENPGFPFGMEWYYEILNDDGSITYQYLCQSGDTIVNDEPTQILVKINTLYDKGLRDEVTHEYVQERDGKVYWWNKILGEFTVLYDFSAEEGDEWEIKVGTESLVMHVDAVEDIEYEGRTYRMLHVSDSEGLFTGDIVCGVGHLTSFFPERLMSNGDGMRVEGLRCYWLDDELMFQIGDEDCDAIYEELHGVEEDGPSTGSGTTGTLTVYPNPTDDVLFVETHGRASLSNQTYRITNLMGQTLMTGQITAETQQIDVSSLPQGMYFITFAGETQKFVVR